MKHLEKLTQELIPISYQNFLLAELSRRQQRNTAYTMTAFARDLKLSKASLSLVLSGRQGLSMKMADLIARSLKLASQEKEIFLNLVIEKHSRSSRNRRVASEWLGKERLQAQAVKNLRKFDFVVTWKHLAVRELVYLKNFQPAPLWISAKLDIGVKEAESLWSQCLLAGWIEQDQNKKWQASEYISLGTGQSNEMLKKMHQEILKQSMHSLQKDPMERRYMSFTFFSVSPEQMKEAKDLIKSFRQQLAITMHRQSPGEKSEVLCFASQLFSVAQDTAAGVSEVDT